MKTVRKLTTAMLAMVLAMLLLLTACGGGGSSSSGSSKPSSSSGKPSSNSSASGTQTSTKVTVTVKSANSSYGTVTGGGSYTKGSSVTVKATPASGYSFAGWKKNGSTISNDASYTFTASESVTLTANFTKIDLSVYKIYKLSDQQKNGYTAQMEVYDSDMDLMGNQYVTTNGTMIYSKTDTFGITTTVLKDDTYAYTLLEAEKIYTKTALSYSAKTSNYAAPDLSAIESITAGKTTVEGVEYYSEKVAVNVSGYTIYTTYCFDSSGNLKYALLGSVTVKYLSYVCTPDTSKLTLDGYTGMTKPVKIEVSASNSAYGTVTGGGIYENGSSVTVEATPAAGYSFAGWLENGWLKDNEVVSNDKSYTFKATANPVVGFAYYGKTDTTLTAEFVETPKESVSIDETHFPDSIFRAYISTNFDTDGDGSLSPNEIVMVRKIDVWYRNITSLAGIEYFSNLRDLNCSTNQIKNLDVSKNTLLTSLTCGGNQLTNLDISKNTALIKLNCSNNQLTKLDVSKNTALTSLTCSKNKLTSLDVSKNVSLKSLSCSNNQLTSLNVTLNKSLEGLDCSDNQLTSLNLSNNTALFTFYCSNNNLTALDVSKNSQLYWMQCKDNKLTSLDITKNTRLDWLECDSNNLTNLDVSKNTDLSILSCSNNQLTKLDVSTNTQLEKLECSGNQLTSLDISSNTRMKKLYCPNNQLSSLDISNNTWLQEVNCSSNKLTSLDISDNEYLIDNGDITVDNGVTVIKTKTIGVTASPEEYGTVTGGGNYTKGTSVTVTATPNTGYQFKEWKLNGVTASGSASYTFAVSSSCELTAVFISEVEENAKLKQFNYSSVAYNGTDYSKYYVLKNFSPSACYKMGNYSALAAHGCTAIADAAAYTAQTGVVVDPTASWNTTVGCTWKWCSVEQTTTTVAQQLSQIYVNLMNGKATIVRFKSAGNEGYSVAAVGIRKGADKSNLTAADFLMIDPSRGKVMAGNQITDNGVLAYMYDRPDGKDYRLRVTP